MDASILWIVWKKTAKMILGDGAVQIVNVLKYLGEVTLIGMGSNGKTMEVPLLVYLIQIVQPMLYAMNMVAIGLLMTTPANSIISVEQFQATLKRAICVREEGVLQKTFVRYARQKEIHVDPELFVKFLLEVLILEDIPVVHQFLARLLKKVKLLKDGIWTVLGAEN